MGILEVSMWQSLFPRPVVQDFCSSLPKSNIRATKPYARGQPRPETALYLLFQNTQIPGITPDQQIQINPHPRNQSLKVKACRTSNSLVNKTLINTCITRACVFVSVQPSAAIYRYAYFINLEESKVIVHSSVCNTQVEMWDFG